MYKPGVVKISEEKERELWEKAMIVWDTSAVCRLYGLTPDARDRMLALLREIKTRLWLPQRVRVEFDRHKDEELKKPLASYVKPKFLTSNHFVSELKDYLSKRKGDSHLHPRMDKEVVETLSALADDCGVLMEKIRVKIEKSLKKSREEFASSMGVDEIDIFFSGLRHGSGFSFRQQMEIAREGVWRYSCKIPPGYMDAEAKESIDRFGDLIIWKEILREAKEHGGKNVIFVTQDLKPDWSAIDNPEHIVPREELLEEFRSETGGDIWIYTISDFIVKLGHYLGTKIGNPFDSLDLLLTELRIAAIPDTCLKLECGKCKEIIGISAGEIDWDWNLVETDEREMGGEKCFEVVDYFECPECGQDHTLKFSLYQYPVGVTNYVDVEAEGCEIIHEPYMPAFVDTLSVPELQCCCRCGEWRDDLDADGFCSDCIAEFNREMERD